MGSLDRGTLPNMETAYFRARLAEFQRRSARDIDWQKAPTLARALKQAKDRGRRSGDARD